MARATRARPGRALQLRLAREPRRLRGAQHRPRHAKLQVPLKVGDRIVRMARYAPFIPVAFVDPGHALVLGGVRDTDEDLLAGRASSTWAFIVEPVDDQTCRLVIRSRGSLPIARLQAPAQFVMQRNMMLGIKHRVESTQQAAALT